MFELDSNFNAFVCRGSKSDIEYRNLKNLANENTKFNLTPDPMTFIVI